MTMGMGSVDMSQRKFTMKEIQDLLKKVVFMDRKFLVMKKGDGFLLQMSYMELDVDEPEKGVCEQKTRKWYVSPFSTETEIIESCWAMVCRSQMHVAGEHFTYKGRRIYSPHFDVNARVGLCDDKRFDGRQPISKNKSKKK